MECGAGFGRLLVDKAKGAGVGALNEAIKQGGFKLKAQVIIPVFFEFDLMILTRRINHIQHKLFGRDRELVVNQIAGRHTINCHQRITGFKPEFLGDRARQNAGNPCWLNAPHRDRLLTLIHQPFHYR